MLADLFSSRAVRDPVWDAWGKGLDLVSGNTSSGVAVTESSAQRLGTVYTCVSFIADALSALPIEPYKDGPGGPVHQPRPVWMDRPNPERSWQEFAFEFYWSLLIDGNAYVVRTVNGQGRTAELWMIHPDRVTVMRPTPQDRPVYFIDDQPIGQAWPAGQNLYHERVYPVPNQVKGLSPVMACSETIGLGIGLESYAGRFFGNSATPSGVIEAPGQVTADQAAALRARWEEFHRGVTKSHGIAVLSGGAVYRPITIAPEAAQFLESRNFNSAQIAALFKLPPEIVGATLPTASSITYANITDRWTELLRRWLPWIRKMQTLVTVMLPGPGERGWRAEVDTDEYSKADIKTRFDSYAVGIGAGVLTVDEAREEEGLRPLGAVPNPEVIT